MNMNIMIKKFMIENMSIVLLATLVLCGPARADQLEVFKRTLTDVVTRSKAFSLHARADLNRGGPNQNAVIAASGELSRGSQTLRRHLEAKAVSEFNGDLENIGGARDAIDGALPKAGATSRLKNEWGVLREAVDAMMQIASGDQGATATSGESSEGPQPVTVTAPPVPVGPRVSRVNLIGPEELHLAAGDIAAIVDLIAGQVRRAGRMDGNRRAALDALGAMRRGCDALAGAPTVADMVPEAQQMGGLINAVDRTLPNLGDYGTRRPLWQQARRLALGVIKFAH